MKTIQILIVLLCSLNVLAETTLPEVGKKIPDFSLNVVIPATKKITPKTVKGKWLIIDFWALTCRYCIQSFGKTEQLHRQFKDKIDLVLVGREDGEHNKGSRQFYETLAGRKGYTMMAAFDSVLFERWDIVALPHILIVDPQGVLRYITDGRDMTPEKLTNLLVGKPVTFYQSTLSRPDYEPSIAISPDARADGKLISSSLITRWNGEDLRSGHNVDTYVSFPEEWGHGWYASMAPLHALYSYAYIGKWGWVSNDTALYAKFAPWPVLSVADSSLFAYDYLDDIGKGTYSYFLSIPEANISRENLMMAMQADLKRAFGFEVALEIRPMPVLKVVRLGSEADKLRTKGGNAIHKTVPGGIIIQNSHISWLARILAYRLDNKKLIPIIDGTGISESIDITLQADMTDLEDIRAALKPHGLDIVGDKTEMKVVVIRDPDPRR